MRINSTCRRPGVFSRPQRGKSQWARAFFREKDLVMIAYLDQRLVGEGSNVHPGSTRVNQVFPPVCTKACTRAKAKIFWLQAASMEAAIFCWRANSSRCLTRKLRQVIYLRISEWIERTREIHTIHVASTVGHRLAPFSLVIYSRTRHLKSILAPMHTWLRILKTILLWIWHQWAMQPILVLKWISSLQTWSQ